MKKEQFKESINGFLRNKTGKWVDDFMPDNFDKLLNSVIQTAIEAHEAENKVEIITKFAKLQDLEAAILNLREEIRVTEHPSASLLYELQVLEEQAKAIKWVLL